jgi:hypothetical protein
MWGWVKPTICCYTFKVYLGTRFMYFKLRNILNGDCL